LNFLQKLRHACQANDSFLCVGLDPDPQLMPPETDVNEFVASVVEATSDLVTAYKINFAFFEAMGEDGFRHLNFARKCIPANIPIIADAKRADIGSTSCAYAKAIFEVMGFDAVTVSPYMGSDSIMPFISYADRGVFILCRTSNPGAKDFQDLLVTNGTSAVPLYQEVSRKAGEWNQHGNIGLVVGATWPQEIELIRKQNPDMPLLIPGIGAQGGDIKLVSRYAIGQENKMGIINVSRSIIYASCEKDYATAARVKAQEIRNQINVYRKQI